MIVKYDGKGLLVIPVVTPLKPGEQRVRGTGGEDLVKLIPGFNEVPDSKWNLVRSHLESKIEKGTIVEWCNKYEKDEKGKVIQVEGTSLRRFRARDAKEAVQGCYNLDSLSLWLEGYGEVEQEVRDEIRVAIKEQIDLINSGGKKK